MSMRYISSLLDNAQLLVTLSILYELSKYVAMKFKKSSKIIEGVIIGCIGIAIMTFPLQFSEGLVFDTRSILIASASLAFSQVSVVIAALMMAVYRLYNGGVGMITGILVIAFSYLIGNYWRKNVLNTLRVHKIINLYLFGVVVHGVMLLCMFAMPYAIAINTIQSLGLNIMLIYPIGTVMISLLLLAQKDRDTYQRRIREAEERYRSIFNNDHAPMMLLDPSNGQIVDVNPAAAKFYGWSIPQMLKMNINQINTLPTEKIMSELDLAEVSKKTRFVFKHRLADDSTLDVEVTSGPIYLNDRKLLYSIIHDISERVASVQALQESEKRFRLVIDSAPDTIFIQTGGNFAFVNNAALKLFGVKHETQLLNHPVLDYIHPKDRDSVKNRIRTLNDQQQTVPALEETFLRADGTPVDVEAVAVPIYFNNARGAMVFARDITDRKILHREKTEWDMQIRQQQKLEAIGTLAGGVAHEINNPINVIMNFAQLVVDRSKEDSETTFYGKSIIDESLRISEIVKNLLQFSRQEKSSHSYAKIEDIVYRTVSLMNTILKKDQIILIVQFEKDLPLVKCRSQQIQQVLMNLLTNSRDALNEKYPGFDENKRIDISVHPKIREDRRWIEIIVEDQGCGISEDIKEKIYEPFFSTKPKDKGTGLGLSISFGIVKDHHGSIAIETKKNEYSRFIVELPVDNGWEV